MKSLNPKNLIKLLIGVIIILIAFIGYRGYTELKRDFYNNCIYTSTQMTAITDQEDYDRVVDSCKHQTEEYIDELKRAKRSD